ncbi:MAG: hypothetical protein KDD25_00425 [Bdellovibrionales bacterium]|nr:hypothetical protein [Bdellovibrionales bacterium]
MKKIVSSLLLTLSLVACSERYRDVELSVGGDEIYDQLKELSEATDIEGLESFDMNVIDHFVDKGITYYVEAPDVGPIANVTPINPDILDSDGRLRSYNDIIDIRVYFFAIKSGSKFDALLIFDTFFVGDDGEEHNVVQIYEQVSDGEIKDNEFQVAMARSNDENGDEIILSSRDIDGDDLNQVIKLQIRNSNGDILGQITSLKGFKLEL